MKTASERIDQYVRLLSSLLTERLSLLRNLLDEAHSCGGLILPMVRAEIVHSNSVQPSFRLH